MSLHKNTIFIVVICFLVVIVARCLASNLSATPLRAVEQKGDLHLIQDNVITKDAIIQPFHAEEEAPLVFLITTAAKPQPAVDPQVAEVTLANKLNLLEVLQHQQHEAEIDLLEHQKQMELAEKASLSAHLTAEEALKQLSSLTAALHESLTVFRSTDESSKLATTKWETQKHQTEKAQAWLRAAELQLHEIVIDYQATKKAAEIAEKSAQEAHVIAYGPHMDSAIY